MKTTTKTKLRRPRTAPPIRFSAPATQKPFTLSYPDCDRLGGYGKVVSCVAGMFKHTRVNPPARADVTIASPGDASRFGKLLITFWESTRLLPVQLSTLNNNYKAIAVTCDSTRNAMIESGVTRPIYKFPLAIDYVPEPFPPTSPLVFISCSTDSGWPLRKRVMDIVAAFTSEFQTESDVRLLVKRNPECIKIPCFDSRVEFVVGRLPDIKPFLARGHCGVFCSGMEGWGYPAHELMALGRPSILPLATGFSEFHTAETCFPTPYEIRQTPKDAFFNGIGEAPFVGIDQLRRQLRYVYENRHELFIKAGACVRRSLEFRSATMQARLREIINKVI